MTGNNDGISLGFAPGLIYLTLSEAVINIQ